MPYLNGVSFAYPEVPAGTRASLVRSVEIPDGAFYLSTCLRIEVVWQGDMDGISALGTQRSDLDLFTHLCRVAAGLESPVVGETEVLGQFRQAVASFNEASTGPSRLGRALEAAIGIGRAARRRMGGSPRGSLGSVAAGRAAPSGRVAILGAGAMARAAAEALGESEFDVYARRPGLVAGRSTLPWSESTRALVTHPAVISTVPGHVQLFSPTEVNGSLESRDEPLLLIDLGMPPGFEPHPSIRYLGIDDIAASTTIEPEPEADAFVLTEAQSTWARLTVPDRAGSVIAAMVGRAEAAVDEEVQRFAGRLVGAEDPEAVMRQLAHTVARRVLHPSISYVGSTDRDSDAVEHFAEAFGVGDE